MSGNHLTVPDATYNGEARTDTAATTPGRPRSGSQRSANSQRSQRSQRSNENNEVDSSRRPSIRIQRQSSRQITTGLNLRSDHESFNQSHIGRRRSTSEPSRRDVGTTDVTSLRPARQQTYMPNILEGTTSQGADNQDVIQPIPGVGAADFAAAPPLRHARTNVGDIPPTPPPKDNENGGEYENQLVDLLDLVDPEVSTLTTLTNVQNSLFVPDLGRYLNRRPTYILTRRPTTIELEDGSSTDDGGVVDIERYETAQERPQAQRTPTGATLNTITSRVNDKFFAVLPHGVELKGWNEEDKLELNNHVRHMLHSRRSKFKRSMRGFGQYIRKPLGFFVTLYATLITLFGLAWVLFLIGWINIQGRQSYLINVIDNVLVALFAVVGDGLAPFRAVDTYHMCFIAHYHHLTWRLRREKSLSKLQNRSDLPAFKPGDANDPEKQEYSVLSCTQQKRLEHHQKKFSKSHSFYKPHETITHNAFSLRLLVAVVVLLDCHSLLQIALGTCTWAISYHVRPFALTTVILCCSITCNITAGVLISVGDHKSRKKDVIERMFRQQLTEEAMEKVQRNKKKELEKDLIKKGLGSEAQLRYEMSQTSSLPAQTFGEEKELPEPDRAPTAK